MVGCIVYEMSLPMFTLPVSGLSRLWPSTCDSSTSASTAPPASSSAAVAVSVSPVASVSFSQSASGVREEFNQPFYYVYQHQNYTQLVIHCHILTSSEWVSMMKGTYINVWIQKGAQARKDLESPTPSGGMENPSYCPFYLFQVSW